MTARLVSCRHSCVRAAGCNSAVMFIRAFNLIKLRMWFWLAASPQGAHNLIRHRNAVWPSKICATCSVCLCGFISVFNVHINKA